MSAIQEEKLHLQKCIAEEESGKVFSLSIQVHNSLEKKDSREPLPNMRLPEVTITDASLKKCKVSLLSCQVIFK